MANDNSRRAVHAEAIRIKLCHPILQLTSVNRSCATARPDVHCESSEALEHESSTAALGGTAPNTTPSRSSPALGALSLIPARQELAEDYWVLEDDHGSSRHVRLRPLH